MQDEEMDAGLKDVGAPPLPDATRDRVGRLARAAFMDEVARRNAGPLWKALGVLVPALLGSAAVVHTATAVVTMVRVFGGG